MGRKYFLGIDVGGTFTKAAMCGIKKTTYKPKPENHAIYKRVYALYKQIHDAFGTGTISNVMKELLNIKDLCAKS